MQTVHSQKNWKEEASTKFWEPEQDRTVLPFALLYAATFCNRTQRVTGKLFAHWFSYVFHWNNYFSSDLKNINLCFRFLQLQCQCSWIRRSGHEPRSLWSSMLIICRSRFQLSSSSPSPWLWCMLKMAALFCDWCIRVLLQHASLQHWFWQDM